MNLDPQYPSPPNVPGRPVLDPKQTPLVDVELAGSILHVYRTLWGKELGRRGLCCFLAQVILETGRVYCYWWDIGNVKASASYRGMVQYYRCSEIIAGVEQHFDPYNPVACFRAWQDLGQGVEQHLRFLGMVTNSAGRPNRYQAMFDAAVAGDIVGMIDEAARAGYMTANKDLYLRGAQQLFAQEFRDLPPTIEEVVHTPITDVLQPTSGRSPFSDADLKRIAALQIPLTVDWNDWRQDVQQQLLDEDLP